MTEVVSPNEILIRDGARDMGGVEREPDAPVPGEEGVELRGEPEAATDAAVGRTLPVDVPAVAVAVDVVGDFRAAGVGGLADLEAAAIPGKIGMKFLDGNHYWMGLLFPY
jgi:hypothetical protein